MAVETVVTALYYVIVAYFAAMLLWNFVRTRDLQKAVLFLVVLTPFLLRLVRLK